MDEANLKEHQRKNKKVINSKDLFEGASELIIHHKEDLYRLMITKAGKLILNK